MEANEAVSTVRALLKTPSLLKQSTTHIEKQIVMKGFLRGLVLIAVDGKRKQVKEQLISLKQYSYVCFTSYFSYLFRWPP